MNTFPRTTCRLVLALQQNTTVLLLGIMTCRVQYTMVPMYL